MRDSSTPVRFILIFIALNSSISLIGSSKTLAHPVAPGDTCLQCHGNQEPELPKADDRKPPLWAHHFSMDWLMYEFKSDQSPPFDTIPNSHLVNRGQTYYDWDEKKMIEIYFDHCINIFPIGNDFSCKFLSRDKNTFLIKYPLGNLKKPKSCCLWSDRPFWAPRPDVLLNMRFQKETRMNNQPVNWWILNVPLPGPFGYGTAQGTSQPVTFWFPVIGAWVQQNFSNYSNKRPGPVVFELPNECLGQLQLCH